MKHFAFVVLCSEFSLAGHWPQPAHTNETWMLLTGVWSRRVLSLTWGSRGSRQGRPGNQDGHPAVHHQPAGSDQGPVGWWGEPALNQSLSSHVRLFFFLTIVKHTAQVAYFSTVYVTPVWYKTESKGIHHTVFAASSETLKWLLVLPWQWENHTSFAWDNYSSAIWKLGWQCQCRGQCDSTEETKPSCSVCFPFPDITMDPNCNRNVF